MINSLINSKKNYFNWILPLNKKLNLFNCIYRNDMNYFIPASPFCFKINKNKPNDSEKKSIKKLTNELSKKFGYFFSYIVDEFCFKNYSDLKKYYLYTLQYLKKNNVKLCILGSYDWCNTLLIALAAKKLNIKTAYLPHGFTPPSFSNIRKIFFDYNFCFGLFDKINNQTNNIKNNLYASIRYYENFNSNKKIITKNKKLNCLIFDIDQSILDPFFQNKEISRYRDFLIKKLSQKYNIIGFKSRSDRPLNKNLLEYSYNNKHYPVFYRDSNLVEILDKVDFAIGPPASCFVETLIMKKKYYLYYQRTNQPLLYKKNYLTKIYHTAENLNDLYFNVLNLRTFKKNFNTNDIIKKNREIHNPFFNFEKIIKH